MSESKRFFTENEIEGVLLIITDLYIENKGRMPSDRQLKKCKELNSSRYALMRRFAQNQVNEEVVRKRAMEAGYDFASPEARRVEGLKKVLEERKVMIDEPVRADNSEKEEKLAAETVLKPRRKRGRKGANPVEVVADFKALMTRLGRVPKVADIREMANGAKFSYETYRRHVGSKERWEAIWNEMQKGV